MKLASHIFKYNLLYNLLTPVYSTEMLQIVNSLESIPSAPTITK